MEDPRKWNFWWICFKIASQPPLRPKNHSRGAFGTVASDWDLVRPYRLLSRITMILRMSARTYNTIWTPLKIFFERFKVSPHVSQKLNLSCFPLKMGIKPKKSSLTCVLKHSNRLRCRMITPLLRADILRIKAIRESKRYGRRMSQSDSTVPNAPLEWFFGFKGGWRAILKQK